MHEHGSLSTVALVLRTSDYTLQYTLQGRQQLILVRDIPLFSAFSQHMCDKLNLNLSRLGERTTNFSNDFLQ